MTPARHSRVLAGCAAALVLFVFLAVQVTGQGAVATEVDPAITAWFAAHRAAVATVFMRAVSLFHGTTAVDAGVVLVAAFLGLARQRWRDALWIVAAVQSSMLLNVLLKNVFHRPRPALPDPLVQLSTFSFPSGHALAATAFWGCVLCIVPAQRRGPAMALAGVLVVLVALSRMYLGAHFASDVVAGVCEGVVCVSAWSLLLRRR